MKLNFTHVDRKTREPITDHPEPELEMVDLNLAPADVRKLKRVAARDGITEGQLITRAILAYLNSIEA